MAATDVHDTPSRADALRRWGRDVGLPWLVCGIVFTWVAHPSWDTVVDDAFISARYAEVLADGGGLSYAAASPPVEGFTNLAWTLLLALGRLLGAPMHPLLTTLGWAFGLVALGASAGLTARLAGLERVDLRSWIPAALLAVSVHMAVASTNGLESSMMVAMVLLAAWTHLRALAEGATPGDGWIAAGAAAGLVLTRPEGLVAAAILWAHTAWARRRDPVEAMPATVGTFGTFAALTLFRLVYFGMPLPNTWYAKSSFALERTFEVNANYLMPDRYTLYAYLAAWIVGTLLPPWTIRKAAIAAVALALGLIPLTVTLWMPGLRLFLPAAAVAACLVGAGLRRAPAPAGLAIGLALVAGLGWTSLEQAERVRHYDWRHSVQPDNGTARIARHLREAIPDGEWVATRDAGVLAYYVGPRIHVGELHHRALTLPHPGGAHADVLSPLPTNPAAVVVTQRREETEGFVYGNDRAVLQRLDVPYVYVGRVRQHFHRYYDVYVRGDLQVPPPPQGLVVSQAGPMTPVIRKMALP